jgi:NADH-quinone oxidoreductase subunit N
VNDSLNDFVRPALAYLPLSPLLIALGTACLGVLVEAFVARRARFMTQVVLTLTGLVAALVAVLYSASQSESLDDLAYGTITAAQAIAVDGPTYFLWAVILLLAIAGALLFAERKLGGGLSAFVGQAAALPGTDAEREASTSGLEHTEVFPLFMFAVSGMLLFPAANDLITMFVALEVMSLPLYLLCALARRRRLLSQEAALKYFLLGAFSSAFLLFGIALCYGYSGSLSLAALNESIQNDSTNEVLLLLGIGLVAVGMLFKVGAVPFQSWTPDVYQGAPTPVTAFMAAATKVAAFGALVRLFYVGFGSARADWQPMLWIVAIASMVVGVFLALTQTDVKRMLAYSSVAHTGFILTGVLGLQAPAQLAEGEITSLQAVLFYLATYGFATLGAFAIVSLVRDASGEVSVMSRWKGLGKQSPLIAGSFGLFLLAMAGIPLTAGFVGKWAVFAAAAAAGAWPVVIAAILSSVVAAGFYVRLIVLMFFSDAEDNTVKVTEPSFLTTTAIAMGVAITILLGIVPGPMLEAAAVAGQFIR